MVPRRFVRSDLEHQIELPVVATTMLPQLRTRHDRATPDHLGVLHVIVPVCKLALVGDVGERLSTPAATSVCSVNRPTSDSF